MRINALVGLRLSCAVLLCVLLSLPAKSQETRFLLPASPAAPEQMQDCDQLQREWDNLHQQLETEHQNCLDAHSKEKPNPNSGSGPGSICTHSECQGLHDAIFSTVEPQSQSSVQQCRDDVTQYQAAVQQAQQQLQQQVESFRDQAQHVLEQNEKAWDKAKDIGMAFVDKASGNLGAILDQARKTMSPADFSKFDHAVGDAKAYLDAFGTTVKLAKYEGDVQKIIDNPADPNSYRDIIADGSSDGFSYTLERLSPDFLAKLWGGPVGWFGAITFDSTVTQTPQQDFDPMAALNNPNQYTFQQREAALQSLYQSAQNHPEVWNDSKFQWLYSVSEQLYNAPDNPNVHLVPPSPAPNQDIILTPQ